MSVTDAGLLIVTNFTSIGEEWSLGTMGYFTTTFSSSLVLFLLSPFHLSCSYSLDVLVIREVWI